jgi:magnesium chelatase family protein
MSLAVVHSRALTGMHAPEVLVEVHLANGLPSFTIVGLPETEVKESKDRVRAAIQNSRFDMPSNKRITVNLAPADLPKESGRLDLAIAIGILAASGQVPLDALDGYEFAGELSLSGELRPIRGALAMAYALSKAAPDQRRAFILPPQSASEAALVRGTTVYEASSLLEVCNHLDPYSAEAKLTPHQLQVNASASSAQHHYPDMADVKGQAQARRVLEIAAAGKHSLLMVGPPGSGKSMLAARLPSILPPMTEGEALSCAALASLSNRGFSLAQWQVRPYRAPHHTASATALVGGGGQAKPGEVSLAHEGVLFLDELPEFDRKVLEVLREPLESGRITISRAARQVDYEAGFQLAAAMNPCPCGNLGHPTKACRCTPDQVQRYQGKISEPLLDRIDLQIAVPALTHTELIQVPPGESSASIRQRVVAARERQLARQGKPNQALDPSEIDAHAFPDEAGVKLLRSAMQRLGWSARSFHRVLKVARTIADLACSETVHSQHVAEAIQYRRGLQSQ